MTGVKSGRRGGQKEPGFYSRVGKMGGKLVLVRYGRDYFREIAKPKNKFLKCAICGRKARRTNNNQKYCRRCRREQRHYVNLVSFKRRYRNNPEWRKKHLEYAKRWYATNGREKERSESRS